MKYAIPILILALLIISGCGPVETSTDTITESFFDDCSKYTTPRIVQRCLAINAQDMSMCSTIEHFGTKEDCVLVIAELVQDESQLNSCDIAENSGHKVICESLILKDVNHCFVLEDDVNEINDLMVRDCIGLVARKLGDKSVCDNFITNVAELAEACGGTESCYDEWQSGASYEAESCKDNVG